MSDIVKRLRMKDEYLPLGHDGWEAADRIEELEAACWRMKEERDRAIGWRDSDKDRADAAEAKLAKAVDVIDWALICWDDHNKHGYTMQGDWVSDTRTTLAELTGDK